VADDCITSVTPGDHRFTCQGVTFLVMVGDACTRFACGVIFDVHGAAMSAQVQRADTRLHELAPPKGYLVVHPSAPGGAWNLQTDPPKLADFLARMVAAFHADTARVHVTGFSMGSAVTFWFLCNKPDVLASAAPVTGESAEQVRVSATGAPCIASIDAGWRPRVPILFMSGTKDPALKIEDARARAEGIVSRLGLTGGQQVAGDASYTRRRWQGDDGMVFDFLEHGYSNALLGGHCIPGERNANYIACGSGGTTLHWGQVVLQWFVDHPRR
jgi:poly(3-hydroxybutyrate) depolymerase